ncbi:MAG: tRNA adenosine(34) deaminase TadA [Myxococcota bacterium]
MSDDNVFMDQALSLAREAMVLKEVPVGAVVVHQGVIIARAHNRRELDQDPAGHAEFLAMRLAAKRLGSWRLEGCTVYVTLEPCAMCAGAMVLARIDRCVYGCSDPKAGFMGSLGNLSQHPQLNHRFPVTAGVRAHECGQVLKDFFRNIRAAKKRAKQRKRLKTDETP